MKRLLVQTQLSNINYKHKQFDLACDSGWQMVMGRVRVMLELNPNLRIDVMCPPWVASHAGESQCVEAPHIVNADLWEKYGLDSSDKRLRFIPLRLQTNALVTRYDFCWHSVTEALRDKVHYDAVYINDPMHLRNFKALFHVVAGYQPKFFVHSHFVDVPEVPKFPQECSLWLGQCEASLRADYNFWQCESAMLQFFDSMGKWFTQDVVDDVRAKSMPWDDGYSSTEIHTPPNMAKIRFTLEEWEAKVKGKIVLFFPNRISPSSGDYTNGMKFMFDILPQLRQVRQDFVVVCGNPNQKFSNAELEAKCGKNGYIKLTDDTFNRDEYKFVGRHSHISLGLYNADPYGGTASRELTDLGSMPFWLDNYEYASLVREVIPEPFLSRALAAPDLSDIVPRLDRFIGTFASDQHYKGGRPDLFRKLQDLVRTRCSYEATTPAAMRRMGLLT